MNKVSEKIINNAVERAKTIEEKSIVEINELKQLQQDEILKLEKSYRKKLENFYNSEYKKIVTRIDLETKNIILITKREILDDFNIELSEKIKGDKNLYINFLKSMVALGTETGDEELIIPKLDKDIFNDDFFAKIKSNKSNVKTGDIEWGLILKKDRIEFKATVDTAVKYIFDEFEIEISNILF